MNEQTSQKLGENRQKFHLATGSSEWRGLLKRMNQKKMFFSSSLTGSLIGDSDGEFYKKSVKSKWLKIPICRWTLDTKKCLDKHAPTHQKGTDRSLARTREAHTSGQDAGEKSYKVGKGHSGLTYRLSWKSEETCSFPSRELYKFPSHRWRLD